MIAYAAYTTNQRSLAEVRRAGWRVLLSPATGLNNYGIEYALDNGAWSAFKAGLEFAVDPFMAAVAKIGAASHFVVAPDIVEGGSASLTLSKRWLDWLSERVPVALLAVQDGMVASDIEGLLGPRTGIFVGGSTEFKEGTMAMWSAVARGRGAICHVGRVNTVRRIALCAAADVTSFDGSSVSIFSKTMPMLDNARKQTDLFGFQLERVS